MKMKKILKSLNMFKEIKIKKIFLTKTSLLMHIPAQ
jgi:hypothetical protein